MIGIEPDDARFGLIVPPQPYHLDELVRFFVCKILGLAGVGREVVERPFSVFVRNPDRLPTAGGSRPVNTVKIQKKETEALLTILDELQTAQRLPD